MYTVSSTISRKWGVVYWKNSKLREDWRAQSEKCKGWHENKYGNKHNVKNTMLWDENLLHIYGKCECNEL